MQLMLDAEEGEVKEEDLSMSMDDGEEAGSQPSQASARAAAGRSRKGGMTVEEMLGQCMLFLLAGYETTSTALGFLAYELAVNPEVQEKLCEEIDEHFPEKDPKPDYTSVARMPYFDMVLNEVLRLYPIGQMASARECTESCVVGSVPFREGDYVQINMAAVHHDLEHWGPEDTHTLVPERFLPERTQKRDSAAWIPFGTGPRNCVGMRFAMLEVKVTMVRLLKRFVIRSCDRTEIPLTVGKNAVVSPQNGVWVTLEKRSDV